MNYKNLHHHSYFSSSFVILKGALHPAAAPSALEGPVAFH